MGDVDSFSSGGPAVPVVAGGHEPLVSIIVPTKNSVKYLDRCLASIKSQSYGSIELIVVDNYSSDSTIRTAWRYADAVYVTGPERSAQVNFGVRRATGTYVFRVDSDFRLDPGVVAECVDLVQAGAEAVVVHNSPDGSVGLLARVRKFEVDMYKYSLDHTAARFLPRDIFLTIGGLREDVTAGEDYDFQNRLRLWGINIAFADAEAVHMDEPKRLAPVLRKYFKYGRDFPRYREYNKEESKVQLAFVRREYVSHWREFVRSPGLGLLFIGYHSVKYGAGALGYLVAILWDPILRARPAQGGYLGRRRSPS